MSRPTWVLLAMFVALVVRIDAATALPMDADEPIYTQVASTYAAALREGEFTALTQPTDNPEHPALIKLMGGVGIAALGDEPGLVARLAVMRGISVVGGVCLAGLLAMVHPVAGFAIALSALHAKYTAQAYLDAWPLCWIFACLLIWKLGRTDTRARWALLFALLWGLTAASKLHLSLPGLFMALEWARRRPRWSVQLFGLSAAVFWVCNPWLWTAGTDGLAAMAQHHIAFGQAIRSGAAPPGIWEALAPLAMGQAREWHPDVFAFTSDTLLFFGGLLGVGVAQSRAGRAATDLSLARMSLVWLGTALAFLSIWPTRWPQHTLLLMPPLCLGLAWLWEAVQQRVTAARSPLALSSRLAAPDPAVERCPPIEPTEVLRALLRPKRPRSEAD